MSLAPKSHDLITFALHNHRAISDTRLIFGVSVAVELNQKEIDIAFAGLSGVRIISD